MLKIGPEIPSYLLSVILFTSSSLCFFNRDAHHAQDFKLCPHHSWLQVEGSQQRGRSSTQLASYQTSAEKKDKDPSVIVCESQSNRGVGICLG